MTIKRPVLEVNTSSQIDFFSDIPSFLPVKEKLTHKKWRALI